MTLADEIAWLLAREIGVTVKFGEQPKTLDELREAETDIGGVDLIALAQAICSLMDRSLTLVQAIREVEQGRCQRRNEVK